jgi:23S rRNA (uracil1939-C5)-methyltransferase
VDLTIAGVVAGGDGMGRHPDGRVVFVEGGLPGERVKVDITEKRRDFMRARVARVDQPSPDRVAPVCPSVAAGCGGCQWQHVAPGAPQASLKAAIVADALRRLARVDMAVVVGPGVPSTGYRTSLRLAVNAEGRACYRRRHGHELVAVDTCMVTHPRLEELVVHGRYPGAREVILRVGARTGERLVYPDPPAAVGRVVVGSDVVVARRARTFLHEKAAGRRWRVSATSFFQCGPDAAEVLVGAVDRAVGSASRSTLVDAYCGVGVLGGSLGAGRVIGIESHAVAAADASANLAGLDAQVMVAEVADSPMWRRDVAGVDVVVADPSRSGLGPSAVAALSSVGAPVLVLVSCDPASLARDAGLLATRGYRLRGVELVDLFPHTFHVETVSRFERVA